MHQNVHQTEEGIRLPRSLVVEVGSPTKVVLLLPVPGAFT